LLIFGLLLAIAYHLLIDYQKMTTLEIIFEFVTTFIAFGICAMLYYIFSIQVVDIFIENEGINFKKANGKYIFFKEGSIVIRETKNRFIIIVGDNIKLNAYKYMPPKPYHHKFYITSRINAVKKKYRC